MRNYYDIIRPFSDLVVAENLPVQFMGSGGIEPYKHPSARLDDHHDVHVSDAIELPNFRKPTDRRPRDLDFLVMSSDSNYAGIIEEKAQALIKPTDLEVEAFSIHSAAKLMGQLADPLNLKTAVKNGVSDRYATSDGINPSIMKMALPFGVILPPEAQQTYWVHIGDTFKYPVMHFGTSFGNYVTRSTASLRKRNAPKVNEAVALTLRNAPEMKEWILDGPGKAQVELACAFLALRRVYSTKPLRVGDPDDKRYSLEIKPANRKSLLEHPAFLLKDAPSNVQHAALRIARLRALLVARGEDSTSLTNFWLEHILPRIGSTVHHGGSQPAELQSEPLIHPKVTARTRGHSMYLQRNRKR